MPLSVTFRLLATERKYFAFGQASRISLDVLRPWAYRGNRVLQEVGAPPCTKERLEGLAGHDGKRPRRIGSREADGLTRVPASLFLNPWQLELPICQLGLPVANGTFQTARGQHQAGEAVSLRHCESAVPLLEVNPD